MCGRIMIKIKRAYFQGRCVDLMWYERKGIKMKIKGDCGSFPWSMGDIMILNWMWLREFSLGRSVYVTLKKIKIKNMGKSCICLYIMENG
jgi:hypothetical protein